MSTANENKAVLVPLGPDGSKAGDEIYVDFNPEKYSFSWDMTWSPVGQSLQWTKTTPGNLVLTLNFDTFLKEKDKHKVDVTTITGKIKAQLDPGESGGGNVVGCLFQWGKKTYQGLVTQLKEDFTLFLQDGTPVRSVVTITLRPWPEET